MGRRPQLRRNPERGDARAARRAADPGGVPGRRSAPRTEGGLSGAGLGCEELHIELVRAARRLRGRGRHLRAVGQPDHRTRHGHAARLGRDRARAAGGQASLRRRPVRLVHPLRSLHPALSGPRGRREILGPRQAGLREIRRHRNLPRTRTHLRLARPALGCALCQTAVPCEFRRPGKGA